MKIEIKKYHSDLHEEWDALVTSSINGNFLHSRVFFDHNPSNEKDDCSFLFYKKNKLVGVLPCSLYTKDGVLMLHSHLRSTYGGYVVNEEVGTEEAVEMVELTIREAKLLDVKEIIIRNPFRIFHKALCDETDYAMWYHGFSLKSREIEIANSLKGDINEIKKRYENGTKYNVKKAVKEVTCATSTDYKSFWEMLEKNLYEKHGKKPIHTLQEFYNLKEKVGENRIKLFAGFIKDKMVCGAIIFIFDKDIHAQYIASDNNHQDIRPLNAVIDYIIEWGNKEGYEYFNQGTGNSDSGRVVNLGLFHFKEGFGGRGTLRETMSLKL